LPARGDLQLPAAAVADDPAVGQPARGPSADRVHGGRPNGAARPAAARLDQAPARGPDLHVGGRVDRRPARFHLRHLDRNLPGWRLLPPLTRQGAPEMLDPTQVLNPLVEAATSNEVIGKAAGRAIALGVGAGGGAAGAGAGIGMLFGKVIEAVTRQPEMRDEITSIQWLGFALTEAT